MKTQRWLTEPISNLLVQLRSLINEVTDQQYIQKIELLSNATIGQHIRHIIEFFLELNGGYQKGRVSYDERKRDYEIETSRVCALTKLEAIISSLEKDNVDLLLVADFGIENEVLGSVTTNYNRELVYNLEHTIHHMALLRIGVKVVSTISLPEDFGLAASTIKHRTLCAQ